MAFGHDLGLFGQDPPSAVREEGGGGAIVLGKCVCVWRGASWGGKG